MDDESVVFGDVNLRDNRVKSIHGNAIAAGQGGWPYMRYFNKETGYVGAQYEKKTSDRICVELSKDNFKYMREYVQDHSTATGTAAESTEGAQEKAEL